MNLLRACYDWRVLVGLGVVGIGIFLLAPGIAAAALPLLVVAACPLSMLLMMKFMGGQQPASTATPLPPTSDERVATLRSELADLRRRQKVVAGELAAIEATGAQIGSGTVEAEPVR